LAQRPVFRQYLPCWNRHGEAFEFECTEVLALEKATDLPPGGRVDHHLVWPGKALQACRKVWGLTDRCLLACVTRADRLTYDHKTRCNTDTDLHGSLADNISHRETGPHSAFGIGLAGFGPAEIDEHTVANIASDEATKRLGGGCDAGLIGADDLPQILGIEARREGSGADEIAEHNAERAAFGSG
jgi:hypothetical protein